MIEAGLFLEDVDVYRSKNLISNPEISVILPTYCRGNNGLLSRSIESVLNQTFGNIELIIVDDGSVDETRSVVEHFLENDHRVVYVRNNINSGLPALRVNQGILYSRGKYIAYQFDDDQWYENALLELYASIIEIKGLALVYGKCHFIDLGTKHEILFGEEFSFNKLRLTNTIANNTVLHHKDIPYIHGGYDCHISMKRLCDWDMWLRWSEVITIKHVDKIVSLVEGNQENSLGQTIVLDQTILRYLQNNNQERNVKLSLGNIDKYILDDLKVIDKSNVQEMIYLEHLIPWYETKYELLKGILGPIRRKQNIVVLMQDYNATTNILITNFTNKLKEFYNVLFVSIQHLDHRVVEYADIIMMQRLTYNSPEIERICAAKPSIYMLDDNLLKIHLLNRDEFEIFKPNTVAFNTIENYLKKSDVVFSTTSQITKEVSKYNNNIYEINTNISLEKVESSKMSPLGDKLNIAWIGSSSREEELRKYLQDIKMICDKLNDKVNFYFFGAEKLTEEIPNIKFIPSISNYEEYLIKLREFELNYIISLIEENEFKNDKSPIKLLEATVSGAVGIFSNEFVYSDVVNGQNGYLIQYGDSLFDLVEDLIKEEPCEHEKIYNNAKKLLVDKHTTESQIEKFNQMIECSKLIYNSKGKKCIGIFVNNQSFEKAEIIMNILIELNFEPHIFFSDDQNEVKDWVVQKNYKNTSASFNNITASLSQQDLILMHDFTNSSHLQTACNFAHKPYLRHNSFQTLSEIQLNHYPFDEITMLLHCYTQITSQLELGPIFNINKEERKNNNYSSDKIVSIALTTLSNSKIKDIPLKNKKVFKFKSLLGTILGLKLFFKANQSEEFKIQLSLYSLNKKDKVLLNQVETVKLLKDNFIEFRFSKPIINSKNKEFIIEVNQISSENNTFISLLGKGSEVYGEAIYEC